MRNRAVLRNFALKRPAKEYAVAAILGVALLGALWFSAVVGTPAELPTEFREILCRVH